jgi:hypothetical protein
MFFSPLTVDFPSLNLTNENMLKLIENKFEDSQITASNNLRKAKDRYYSWCVTTEKLNKPVNEKVFFKFLYKTLYMSQWIWLYEFLYPNQTSVEAQRAYESLA